MLRTAGLVVALLLSNVAYGQVTVTATRLSDKPLLSPVAGTFYDAGLFNPAAARLPDGRVLLLTRSQNKAGLSQIGSAVSAEPAGTVFFESAMPVFTPTEPYEVGGGMEDPRLVKIGRIWYLTYTGYNGHDAQLCLATSPDLEHWRRRGIILPAYKGTWNQQWTKSGAIVPRKINGKWWMYYLGTRTLPGSETADGFSDDRGGHTVDFMGLASSTDLIHWKDATLEPVLPRRMGSDSKAAFDSRVMEPGPPPLLTPAGILLLYNGADSHLVYRTGWALFDLHDPSKLLARADVPFLQPELPWEKAGQVPNVVFLEGMVAESGHPPAGTYSMLGYYGAGDTNVGVVRLKITVNSAKTR